MAKRWTVKHVPSDIRSPISDWYELFRNTDRIAKIFSRIDAQHIADVLNAHDAAKAKAAT